MKPFLTGFLNWNAPGLALKPSGVALSLPLLALTRFGTMPIVWFAVRAAEGSFLSPRATKMRRKAVKMRPRALGEGAAVCASPAGAGQAPSSQSWLC